MKQKIIVTIAYLFLAASLGLLAVQFVHPKADLHQQLTHTTEQELIQKYLKDKYNMDFTISSMSKNKEGEAVRVHAYGRPGLGPTNRDNIFTITRLQDGPYSDTFAQTYFAMNEKSRVAQLANAITNQHLNIRVHIGLPQNVANELKAPMPPFESFITSQPPDSVVYSLTFDAPNQIATENVQKHADYLHAVWQKAGIHKEAIKLNGVYVIQDNKNGNLTCRFDKEIMAKAASPAQLVPCFKAAEVR